GQDLVRYLEEFGTGAGRDRRAARDAVASPFASDRGGREAAGHGEVHPPVDLAKEPPRAHFGRTCPPVREDEYGVVGRKQVVHREARLSAREGGLGALEPPKESHRINAVVL